ncbi:type II secretion system minor pseudopilin GspI [Vibrio maerlii]|uniref:type II secretion system minor pseudopilin GspI n=1 Tax=Vibrio maerlii TaxID=2231648 RepID=UPI001F13A96C|nr:type II secretion system minor pseudopilin GspI [Vibrio maerlii]
MRGSIKRSVYGMTLLEVLVALAIFATASIAVIRSVSQHLNTLSYLEEKMFAAMVLDNQMAEVMLGSTSATTASSGSEELVGQEWFWTVTPIPTQDGLLSAFDVSVAAEKGEDPVITVRSYVEK